jgi:glutathione peroxidase
MNTIHPYKVKSIEGGEIDLAAFSGKKVLIVNVAGHCGYTPQYAQLQELYETFGDRLAVIGFPCNDFGGQEPGNEQEIRAFCTLRYGVTFPLSAKIRILGDDPHPVYRWLTQKALNGVQDSTVTWNFQKYLLDEQGRLLGVFPPSMSVFDIQEVMA